MNVQCYISLLANLRVEGEHIFHGVMNSAYGVVTVCLCDAMYINADVIGSIYPVM